MDSETGIDTEKVLHAARMLREGDVRMLEGVISYVGAEAGLKGRVLTTLRTSRDESALGRLAPVLQRLSDDEILWLSENPEELRRRRK